MHLKQSRTGPEDELHDRRLRASECDTAAKAKWAKRSHPLTARLSRISAAEPATALAGASSAAAAPGSARRLRGLDQPRLPECILAELLQALLDNRAQAPQALPEARHAAPGSCPKIRCCVGAGWVPARAFLQGSPLLLGRCHYMLLYTVCEAVVLSLVLGCLII